MDNLLVGVASALWFGILTSISPCPLATNIAAISFISRRLDKPRYVLLTGLLYTLGRTLAYTVLGFFLAYSLLSAPVISQWLQKYMNKLLGPILILVGMFLLELIKFRTSGTVLSEGMQKKIDSSGMLGAFLLGIIFALSFCPISAGLFFGSLLTLTMKYKSSILLPIIYGIGTALPVIVFSILIMFGVQAVGKAFDNIRIFEFWARRVTGVVFILAGIYYCLSYIFEVI